MERGRRLAMLGRERYMQQQKSWEEVARSYVCKSDPPWVKEHFVSDVVGRGVFAITDISHGQFIVQYDGQLVSEEEGRKREAEEPSVFRYFFKWKNKKYCVDATADVQMGPRLGRLVNHGNTERVRNARIKVLDAYQPCLCLVSTKTIPAGTQILYDYGVKVPWKAEILDMSDTELSHLARHLGHDTKTHKEFYRLSASTVQLSKVARMLIAVDSGRLHEFQGKNLSSIDINDLPEVENEDDDDDDTVKSASVPVPPAVENEEDDFNDDVEDDEQSAAVDVAGEVSSGQPRKKRSRWTDVEVQKLISAFGGFITKKQMPTGKQIAELAKSLPGRSIAQTRAQINNYVLGKIKIK